MEALRVPVASHARLRGVHSFSLYSPSESIHQSRRRSILETFKFTNLIDLCLIYGEDERWWSVRLCSPPKHCWPESNITLSSPTLLSVSGGLEKWKDSGFKLRRIPLVLPSPLIRWRPRSDDLWRLLLGVMVVDRSFRFWNWEDARRAW